MPSRHDRKAIGWHDGEIVHRLVVVKGVDRDHPYAQPAGDSFLDGFIASEFHADIGIEAMFPEVLVDGHARA